MSEEKVFNVHAEINVRLEQQDIDDIMVSALEGGICYWARKAEVVGKYLGEYASEQISRGGALAIWLSEPLDDGKSCYTLDISNFLSGFKLWIENGGDSYGAIDGLQVDCGQIDAGCADEIIQYALFGEIIFG